MNDTNDEMRSNSVQGTACRDILSKIETNTKSKRNFSVVLSGNGSSLSSRIDPPIYFHSPAEIALLSLSTYNSIPNVSETNNTLIYTKDGGATIKTIELNIGTYELQDINNSIRTQMIANGDYNTSNGSFYLNIIGDPNQGKAQISLTAPLHSVSFDVENSIGPLLGFGNNVYLVGTSLSDNLINIEATSNIILSCTGVGNSFVNNNSFPALYSFPLNVPPGYKLIETPQTPVYLPFLHNTLNKLEITILNQDNKPVNLRGETVTIRVHIRET